METDRSWGKLSKILCIRLDSLGDVLMTTPALRALKESNPASTITLLTSPVGGAAARYIPEVDEAILYEAPWMKATPQRTDSHHEYSMAAQLQKAGFDAAVIFTVYSQSPFPAALLCYMAEIPLRLAHSFENPYQLLTDWVPDKERFDNRRHEVRRQLDLVASIGAATQDEKLSFQFTSQDQQKLAKKLEGIGIDAGNSCVVIHPGASAPSRRYPPHQFAAAAEILTRESGLPVIFTGQRHEQPLVESIRRMMRADSFSLAGKLSLGELGALLSNAPLLISNNSGPVHLAAALGTPVVDLYALTNPQHTPWEVPNRVLNYDVPCKYCYKSVCPEGHHNCLVKVPPEQVVQAAQELLAETTPIQENRKITV
jgi:lipopolysaccharide heptosyltransferase II